MSNVTTIAFFQITSVHSSNNSGTNRDRTPIQDNIALADDSSIDHTGGIYAIGFSGSASIYMAQLVLGGGRGSATFPATNDTFTLRLSAEGTIGGVSQEVVHDIIVTF